MDEMGMNILYALLYLFLAPVGGGLLAGLDRKLAARMQRRVGPPVVQPFYDVLKLFEKERIAVNGVCLTVTSIQPDGFTADVMAETIRRSSLGSCKAGSQVNLERAMAADGRFGGHIVSGHIDGTGVIRSMLREENAIWVSIETSPQILHLIVEKGSVCIDGISLTVARIDEAGFQVSVIPHTGEETTLLEKVPGDLVNLENDVIGKYVEKLLGIRKNEEEKKESGITMEFLEEFGF